MQPHKNLSFIFLASFLQGHDEHPIYNFWYKKKTRDENSAYNVTRVEKRGIV